MSHKDLENLKNTITTDPKGHFHRGMSPNVRFKVCVMQGFQVSLVF